MKEVSSISLDDIQGKILSIRGLQVMLDRDLSIFYETETRALKQAVKRNLARFPTDFMFELTEDEISLLVSQSVIPSRKHLGGVKPLAFTEQGVSALSSVLTSVRAVEVSIQIMRAFVAMRRFFLTNAHVFQSLDSLEFKQIQTDQKIDVVLSAIDQQKALPKQGVFYDGQMFDAWKFVSDLIRSAQKSIVLIDNYVDDSVLSLFAKRNSSVSVSVLTKEITKSLEQDVKKFNAQYPPVTIKVFKDSHDRFLIIDEKQLYHLGASLKDLGIKWFAFSKMEIGALEMLENLKKVKLP